MTTLSTCEDQLSAMNAPSRRSTTLLLALILAAFALRANHLDTQSLWYDEGVTATLTQRDLVELTTWTARDIQPPLYYYVVAGWGRLAGWSEWSLRFVSAWWGTLLVPLMALLAFKLSRNRTVAIIAALLTAAHPLLVYYSQEARMYMMVVALGVLAGYYFLIAVDAPSIRRTTWLRYVLVATAAVYTHYFAFFLLLAFAMVGLVQTWPDRRRLLGVIGAHLAVALLFAAWLVPLLTQFSTDRSYWQGTFKVAEAIRAIALRFVVGETVLEQFAPTYLWIAGVLTVLSSVTFLVHAWRTKQARQALFVTITWLLVPTACVLMLAIAVPKFNVRYVLLALPGLILLWSYGAAAVTENRLWQRIRITGIVLPLLAISAIADHNWFTDHSFLKAQWREAAAYVRLHHEPGEAVVLVSGHTWPVWDYYAPDLPAIHLPDLQILDVDAVLDFAESGTALRHALQGYNGAWLVNWQEEVVDPTGVVPIQLEWAGTEKTFRSQFWEVGLRRFVDLDPDAIPAEPPLAEVLNANFGNQLILLGYQVTEHDELLLFWQRHPAATQPTPDWQMTLRTETSDGLLYATPTDRRPVDYNYPVNRWQPGEIVMGVIPAEEWVGPAAMPDTYQLQLGVYDPASSVGELAWLAPNGQPQGQFVTFAATQQGHTSDKRLPIPDDVVQITPDVRAYLPPPHEAVEQGGSLVTTLLWYLEDSFTTGEFVVRWRTLDNAQVVAESALPLPSGRPLAVWPRHDWLRHVVRLRVPVDLPAGDYLLALEPLDGEKQREVNPIRRRITVTASTRRFTPPNLDQPLDIALFRAGEPATPQLRLLGLVTSAPTTIDVNRPITLTLAWQLPESASP
ncbi:MAG TPA: glycosyltransferase family 39 protein, partial [Caldilineaceae bacterium]|nr:glycosyltransferase family 39 protein [Caldilineaceae bacterium]